jgi:outer membrane protein insertion porin family
MRRACLVLVVVLVAAAPAGATPQATPPASPQAPAAPAPTAALTAQPGGGMYGQPVTAIHFDVEGRLDTSPALLSFVDVAVGKPLSPQDVRSSMDGLVRRGRFEDVTPVATRVPGGVEITFRLVPRHPINALDITGDTGLDARALKNQIEQRYGGVPTGESPEAVEQTAEQLLNDAGYLNASVSSSLVLQHDPDSARLVLDVDAGPLARIGKTAVEGSSPFTADQVIARTGTRPGEAFRRRQIETSISAVEDDLRLRGFYQAQASLESTPTAGGVDLVVSIETGPRVELRVEPKGTLPGRVDDLIPIKRERSADQDLLEDSKARIEDALRREGYADAKAAFSSSLESDGTRLVITCTIDRGPRYFVDRVDLPAGLSLPEATVRDLLHVDRGDVFDEPSLVAGLSRVIDEYRRRGFYRAAATPDRQIVAGRGDANERWVVVRPNIEEGPRGVIHALTIAFTGDHQMTAADLGAVMTSRVGQPYVELDAAGDRDRLRAFYLNRGFRTAIVDIPPPTFSDDGQDVTLDVTVREGPQLLIGAVTVVGNERVSTNAIREEMGLAAGQPLGDAALAQARERVTQMAVFRRVSVTWDELPQQPGRAQVIVNVVEAPATTLGWGGGLEVGRELRTAESGLEDHLEVSPRGFFEIGRQNLGGRNRSVNFFSRVAVNPRSAPDDPTRDGRGLSFSEYRVSGTYRERHAFRSDTDILIGVTAEQGRRTTFNFARQGANADIVRQLSPTVSISGRYEMNVTRLFDERIPPEDQLDIDRLFPQVRLSILSSGITWDRRDTPLSPTRGTFMTADIETAARAIASEVGYVKTFFQASAFHALNAKTVLAMRAEVGMARGFERTVAVVDADGQPVRDADGNPVFETVSDVPASQRFFAGGGTTVRGFQTDRLGVPEVLNADGLSLGGNGVVILNAELRRVVGTVLNRNFAVVGFLDGGNVFAHASDIDLDRIRRSVGGGVRWDSPLGPLRFDVGFKLNRLDISTTPERGWEYHLSIGEAF